MGKTKNVAAIRVEKEILQTQLQTWKLSLEPEARLRPTENMKVCSKEHTGSYATAYSKLHI